MTEKIVRTLEQRVARLEGEIAVLLVVNITTLIIVGWHSVG